MHEQPPLPQVDTIADYWEQEQQASIYEDFVETVFEYAGQQGTLKQLLDMCPVPPEARSFAATERFTARLIEQAGLDIPDRFAHLRSEPSAQPKPKQPIEPLPVERSRTIIAKPEPLLLLEPLQDATHEVTLEIIPEAALIAATFNEDPDLWRQVTKDSKDSSEPIIASTPVIPLVPTLKVAETQPLVPLASQVLPPSPRVAPVRVIESELLFTSEVSVPTVAVEQGLANKKNQLTEVAVPNLTHCLGELYETAVSETEKAERPYQASTISDETIIDLLELDDGEVEALVGEELVLPAITEESIPNTLSSTSSTIHPETELTPEPTILFILPTELAAAYYDQFETLPAEEAEQLTELVETMSLAVERLQVLMASERSDSEEAVQIVAILQEYYDQLCNLLEVQIDADERLEFIRSISTDVFERALEAEFVMPEDEGTHEFKRVIVSQAHQIPILLLQRTANLARYIVGLRISTS